MIEDIKDYHMDKLFKEYGNNTYTCGCGHRVFILAKEDKKLCSYCGHYVFKSKRDKDLYRINEKIRRLENDR